MNYGAIVLLLPVLFGLGAGHVEKELNGEGLIELSETQQVETQESEREIEVSEVSDQDNSDQQGDREGNGDVSLSDADQDNPGASGQSNEDIVRIFCIAYFGEQHWPALRQLVHNESGFDNHAQNPWSTAYGLFQFLDQTWVNYGFNKTSDPIQQTEAGMEYIKTRYGNPTEALYFWTHIAPTQSKTGSNWY